MLTPFLPWAPTPGPGRFRWADGDWSMLVLLVMVGLAFEDETAESAARMVVLSDSWEDFVSGGEKSELA